MNNLCIIATLSYLTVLVPLGFVLKISIVWFGFAAGVGFEAVAMPRRQRFSSYSGAMPLVFSFAADLLGHRPHQGHSPKLKSTRMAGQSHRREANSGGKAEPYTVHDSRGRALSLQHRGIAESTVS